MGGKALKKTNSIRLTQKEFFEVQNIAIEKLKDQFEIVIPIKAYKNKLDFGDLDILVSKPKPEYKILKEFLEKEFNTKEIVNNGSIVSFEYNNFQIDLIFETKENLNIAEFYFSYNDLNNIIGKIAYSFGLKFGFDGLYYPLRTEHGNLSEEVLLTKNPEEIYNFLDYDYKSYLKGFDSLEAIFEFVISSKYFSSDKYLKSYEELSTVDKTRIKKRKTYNEFILWLEKVKPQNNFNFNEDKTTYIDFIANFFPNSNLKEKINEFKNKQNQLEEISTKFNGKIIMSLYPNLNGKELGEFIIEFKKYLSKENSIFEDIIYKLSANEIEEKIKVFYSLYK